MDNVAVVKGTTVTLTVGSLTRVRDTTTNELKRSSGSSVSSTDATVNAAKEAALFTGYVRTNAAQSLQGVLKTRSYSKRKEPEVHVVTT